MANKIQFKRGLKAQLPALSVGEPGLTTDTRELFIGHSAGNIGLVTTNQLVDIMSNVKNYGADPTGVVDSAASIQSAIDYVYSAGGGIVFVPTGLYKIGTTIRIKSGVNLCGTGASTFQPMSSLPATKGLLTNDTVSGNKDVYYDSNIKLYGICFDGNNSTRVNELVTFVKAKKIKVVECSFINTPYIGMAIGGCFDVLVDGCFATNTGNPSTTEEGGAAIWVGQNGESKSRQVNIVNCLFDSLNWSGLYFNPEGGVIQRCEFINCSESSIFSNHTGSDISYLDNYIYASKRKHISACGIESGASRILIRGNRILECQDFGVALTDVNRATISDNLIYNNGQDTVTYPLSAGIGIITLSPTPNQPRNVKIHDNQIGDTQTIKTQPYGIAVTGSGASVEQVEIYNNNLNGNKTAAVYIAAGKLGDGSYTSNNAGHASATPRVVDFQAPATTGNFTVSGIGFKPRWLQLIATEPSASRGTMSISTVSNASSANYIAANGTTAVSSTSGKAIALYDPSGGLICEANLVSMNENGFVLNFTNVSARPYVTVTAHP